MTNDKIRQDRFFEFMKFPDGTPIVNIDLFNYLVSNGFFTKPASTKFHGNCIGGLFEHCYEVANCLVHMTQDWNISWTRPESPYIVGMFHDLCKVDDYTDENAQGIAVMGTGSPISNNPKWIHNPDCILNGHGEKSIMMLSQFMTLTEEELLCIRFHMGAYVTDDWSAYDKAIRKYQTVLWTHTADMYASKVLNT